MYLIRKSCHLALLIPVLSLMIVLALFVVLVYTVRQAKDGYSLALHTLYTAGSHAHVCVYSNQATGKRRLSFSGPLAPRATHVLQSCLLISV